MVRLIPENCGIRTLVCALALLVASVGSAQTVTRQYVPGEIIVKLKGKAKTLQAQAFVGKAVSEKSMELKGSWAGLNMHHFGLRPGQSVEDAINELKNDPDVDYVEPNYIVTRQSISGPEGEPVAMSDVQAASVSSSSTYTMTAAPISLTQAWAAMSTASLTPPVVAVIDTGLDLNHSVFVQSGAIWTNPNEIAANGIDDDNNGYIDDVHGWNFVSNTNNPQDDEGHGTHCSGIVLGTTQDITASPIAAAKIRIMPVKFLDSTGSGSTANAIKAIYYAVNNGAKVLSNSWGGGGQSNALLDAITYAYSKKTAFVAAAGNASSNNDAAPTYPANYNVPNVISIAATSDVDGFASFSNYGAATVHVGSPGVSIWSTYPNNTYVRLSGTSMATPFVAGITAMMMRESPDMTGYQAKSIVFSGAQAVSSLVNKTTTQSRINVYNSLVSAKSVAVTGQPAYDASSQRAPSSDAASSGAPSLGGCGLVTSAIYGGSGGSSGDGDGGGLSGPQKNVAFFGLLLILMAPVLLSLALRQRSGRGQRKFERYQIDSQVRLRFGDRELVGSVSTISLGGLQLNTDAWLEKGGVVKMQIRSPDGRDEIQVEGKVVWSEEHKRYGVAFANANEGVLSSISRWSQSLLKA